ncbi:MAG: polyprenyl synthetase family protein [Gammaproteobacteria bacterium]|nr:polyprenyl synthetase family protein [Gammaproteobacteria bacterium]
MTRDNPMHAWQQRVNQLLRAVLPVSIHPLHQAMTYSVLNGGKRFRPALLYICSETLNVTPEAVDNTACAVELIHCYSLIHDDLPAMDNDDFRRGKPTCHKAFDEGIAILAGDALQTCAFDLLAQPNHHLNSEQQLKMITLLSQAIGANGMAYGQALDITALSSIKQPELEELQINKTGKFIKACVELALLAANCQDQQVSENLTIYGDCLGLAFQIRDDILDIEGKFPSLGKLPGVDLALGKATYPSVIGLEQAREKLHSLHQQALSALAAANLTDSALATLIQFTIMREK